MSAIGAGAIRIARFYQAYCTVDGCDWAADQTDRYQEAEDARKEHLDEHRAEASEEKP